MIEMVVVDLIQRHIVTKLVICTRIERGHRSGQRGGVRGMRSGQRGGQRSGQRGGQREEHPATIFWKKKQHDFSTQFGPVVSFYLHVSCIG